MKFLKIASAIVLLVAIGIIGVLGLLQIKHQRQLTEAARLTAAFQNSDYFRQMAAKFNKEKGSAAAILSSADRVEVFRLGYDHGNTEPVQGTLLGHVPYLTKGTDQGPLFAARLAAVLLEPKSYTHPGESITMCYMEPGVGFRVWKGKSFVDVILCYNCDQLVVLENNKAIPEQTIGGWITGHFAVAGDFNPARPALVSIAKTAFPQDWKIQTLQP